MPKTTLNTCFEKIFFYVFLMLFFPAFGQQEESSDKIISHTIYITGNTGLQRNNVSLNIFNQIAQASKQNDTSSLIITGNFTHKEVENRDFLKRNLLKPLQDFRGKIFLIPGVEEWQEGNQEYLDDMESFIQDTDNDLFVLPNDGCPIESETINADFELIAVDSQWFLENWDNHPNMNSGCEIKTREQFFVEFKDALKDSHGKTKIVAIHHPVMSNTRWGFINRIGGFTPQSYQSAQQRELRARLVTLAKQFDDVIFVSGKDRNLQLLLDDNLPQIISGAAANTRLAKIREETDFAEDVNGYAKLVIYRDGSSKVFFFEVKGDKQELLFSKKLTRDRPVFDPNSYRPRTEYQEFSQASIYTDEETDKSKLYKKLWGEHYRDIYSKEITVPNLFLEDLPGNMRPVKEGGGQQSRSLRFINDDKNEYTLRALRKSAIRYLQANAVKEHYVEDFLQNTIAQRYVQDFFTTQHPYAPFAISDLSRDLGIYHATPKIYFVPKQKGLGIHNDEYGDELYMFEEHVGDENKDFENFGSPDAILSTTDLLAEIKENPKSYVDEESYIRARLFDMLIGDWDRHEDQWRWGEFRQENGAKVYKPIPRDRDMAFSKYDGPIISLLKAGFPLLRKMQSYDETIDNLKWFNYSAYPLDKSLIKTSTWEDWKEQALYIQNNLSDEDVDQAFASLPKEALDGSIETIKENLLVRRENLLETAKEYYEYLEDFKVVTGTHLDEEFLITRKKNGVTTIEISAEEEPYFKNSYSSNDTEEIWIYGLDGEDHFRIEGEGDQLIELKIIGGEENDIYDFSNTRRVKIYDHKSKENTIINPKTSKLLADSYEINTYDYEKRKFFNHSIRPTVGYDGDAGLFLGVKNIFTKYGLVRNPFSTQHEISAGYYFSTNGFEVAYAGEFAYFFNRWNFGLEARYTGPNYFLNYFGFGNNSIYNRNEVDKDFNRVKMQQMFFAPALIWRNNRGIRFLGKISAEAVEVYYDENSFVGQVFPDEDQVFERQYYAGAEVVYNYFNKSNDPAYPTRGMEFNLNTGYKKNIDGNGNEFGYVNPTLSIDYPLHHSGALILATKLGGEIIIGDNYEFYHAATLGGTQSLRAYRDYRFTGSKAFYQSTDLRAALGIERTNFIPFVMGVTAGFDYGRVWEETESSNLWHYNYGGSFWVSAFNVLTGNVGFYHGREGNRLIFTFGFHF